MTAIPSIQPCFDPYSAFVPVGDDQVAVTFDLERAEVVMIKAVSHGPVIVVPDTVRQVAGSRTPVMRPQTDYIAEHRLDATADALSTIRKVQRSIEQTTRQEREPLLV